MAAVLCTTCDKLPAKYKCPACSSHTCSLSCSKQHKITTKCSGKRNQTRFIPRSKFDDASINNDYNFLTTLERDLDNAARLQSHHAQASRNVHALKAFVKRAKDVAEVTVQFAPRGMKRARMNKSAWVPKQSRLSWTVEWLFEGHASKVSDRVLDSTTLHEAAAFYKRKVEPAIETLKNVEMEKLHFLIRDEQIGGGQEAVFCILDGAKTLSEALRHRTVIEYPTIHVYSTIPSNLKLERQYAYVQPTVESLATSLVAKDGAAAAESNDFIAFGANDEDSEESSASDDKTLGKTSTSDRASDLPVIDFDDLKVPYS